MTNTAPVALITNRADMDAQRLLLPLGIAFQLADQGITVVVRVTHADGARQQAGAFRVDRKGSVLHGFEWPVDLNPDATIRLSCEDDGHTLVVAYAAETVDSMSLSGCMACWNAGYQGGFRPRGHVHADDYAEGRSAHYREGALAHERDIMGR